MAYQKGIEQTVMFKMVDSIDFATPEQSISPTVELSLDAGNFNAATNSVVEISNGWYKITLTSTEKTADIIVLKATANEAAQTDMLIITESITASLEDIKGTGFDTTKHSLAERPAGTGSGGGHCAWFDEDLKRATNFFKQFPPEFKSLMLKLDSSTLDSNNQHNLSSIVQHMKDMQFILDSIRISQKTSDKLLLGIANENTLEDVLHG